MANGYKSGGKNFPKGNKFGKGFPKLTEEQLTIKKKVESYCGKLILATYCIMNYDELKRKMLDPKIPAIELMIMRIIERCISKAELPILIWIYTHLGWDTHLNENDKGDIQQAKLIIRLDEQGKPSHLEAKEK